jgi:hypothetical protein
VVGRFKPIEPLADELETEDLLFNKELDKVYVGIFDEVDCVASLPFPDLSFQRLTEFEECITEDPSDASNHISNPVNVDGLNEVVKSLAKLLTE